MNRRCAVIIFRNRSGSGPCSPYGSVSKNDFTSVWYALTRPTATFASTMRSFTTVPFWQVLEGRGNDNCRQLGVDVEL